MKYDVSVVVPVFNEEDSIRHTIEKIHEVMKKSKASYEIIAVNDASKDKSAKILSGLKGIRTITHARNKGYGASLKAGIRAANAKKILITDADGTYPIDSIPSLLRFSDDHDMVVGARDKKNIPLLRRPAKFVINKLADMLSNYKIPDLNSGLRIFDRELCLKFWNLYPERFSFTTTITMAFLTNGYSVKYVPIHYMKRKGKSSIHPIKDTIGFVNLILRLSMYFNPLRVFMPLSAFIFILALLRATRDFLVTSDQHIGGLSLVLFFMAFQVFFFGLIAEIINKK